MAKQAEDTPLLKQYFSIKAQHPEAVLLYRVGDFYETYSDDAVLASKVLGLVLTRRSNGDKGKVEMAGFPHHAIDSYLHKLVQAGYKVAVCDQLEDPALAKTKLVKRGVTEILTPGIAFGESMLDQKEHNYLAGLSFEGHQCGAAFLDVSTGTFQVAQGGTDYIATLLSSLKPKELVVQKDVARAVRERFGDYYITSLDDWAFVYDAAVEKLCTQLQVRSLKGYAVERFPLAVRSAGALLAYLEQTQHAGLRNICSISRIDEEKFVWMDQFTVRNLEIFQSASGRDGVSLVDTIDRCCSPMGSRLLRQWLAMPIMDIRQLDARYDIVQHFLDKPDILSEIQLQISGTGDLERTISRVATGKILPREMLQLGRSLSRMEPIRELCTGSGVEALDKLASGMRNTREVFRRITETLDENPAGQIGKGDVIAAGVNPELDRLREISRGGKEYLLQMQQREIERTGISALKISYNNVFGYYIEVRNSSRDRVPPEWIRKQTLVNAERYITPELKEYEEKILGAEATIYETESRLYSQLIQDVQKSIRDIQENCSIIARLDVLQGFAQQASDRNYCRPVVDKSAALDIRAGRHPVIETLMAPGEEYVPNDVSMDSKGDQIIILTGPNMAGKSALLRQTALIVLMAQIGSFVPAASVRMGWFDKIFTRVGATDNISRGESTFMVEMLETSMIMHNLSARSLVLLDEIGRGTSTYDGMSIARALVEYIHGSGKGAKTLFATHYHELNDLEKLYPRVKNYHIAVKEEGRNVIFLRKIMRGGANRSFGIEVARLAGVPSSVTSRAKEILKKLEKNDIARGAVEAVESEENFSPSEAERILSETDMNNLTPMQAFNLLSDLVEKVKRKGQGE